MRICTTSEARWNFWSSSANEWECPETVESSNGVKNMLEIKGLNKSFGKKAVLENFTYTFESGVYGLLGPNGSGKTTLMRCITKLYPIKRGTVFYNGRCIVGDGEYLTHVGYLPQKFGLFKDLKVREMMELMANLKKVERSRVKPMIEECIEVVNLSDRLKSRVGTLSGGMIRRLGIAQALLGKPEIVIFDEPTAGLDPEERLRFKNIVSEIRRDRTVIISTHIVEDVEAVCDTIVIMRNRNIAASGSCSQIRETARGKVYLVPEKEKDSITGECLVQKQFERDGEIMLKILTNVPQKYEPAAPDVEDGYICALKDI